MNDTPEYALLLRQAIMIRNGKDIGKHCDWDIAWTLWSVLLDTSKDTNFDYYGETMKFMEHWSPFQ